MKKLLLVIAIFASKLILAQVGINTTTPDASSMLDISATDKGVLVPRVNLSNVTLTSLDGTNTAATGLLIWNTNAATTGGNGVGFYFFNGTQWMPITQTTSSDDDWYTSGTTNSPTNITDNIVTQGTVTLGNNNTGTTNSKLHIKSNVNSETYSVRVSPEGTAPSSATRYGIYSQDNGITPTSNMNYYALYNFISSTHAGSALGLFNDFLNQGGAEFGLYNRFNSTEGATGIRNEFLGTTTSNSAFTGLENRFLGSTTYTGSIYGVNNILSAEGNGTRYGVYNSISGGGTGNKYGSYNSISSAAGGIHYGVYSDVEKSNSYAGYFIGSMSLGNDPTIGRYLMPASDGTSGQVIATDGAGNLSFQNAGVDTDDQFIDNFSLTGNTLNLSIDSDGVPDQTVDLSTFMDNTDDQTIDGFALIGTDLYLSLENDGQPSQIADLSSLNTDDQTIDAFALIGTTLNLSLENDGQPNVTIDLSPLQDGTGTDDQIIDTFGLSGTILGISLENDGLPIQTVDLSSLQDGTGTDDQTIDNFSFNPTTNILTLEIENDGIVPQTVNLSSLAVSDIDWYEVGTSTAPNNLNDNIYTLGNVGIGTSTIGSYTSASQTLTLGPNNTASSIDPTFIEIVGNTGVTNSSVGGIHFENAPGSSFGNGIAKIEAILNNTSNYAGHLSFYTGNSTGNLTEKMRIEDNGDIGIGTTNPTATLDVVGTFQYVDGNEAAGRVLTSDALGNASWATTTGESTTASNGLTETINDIQLGGALTQATTITQGNFNLNFASSGTGEVVITNTGTNTNAVNISKIDNSTAINSAANITKTTNGSGAGTGVNLTMNGAGTGTVTGFLANISNTSNSIKIGLDNNYNGTGSGTLYGTRNQFYNSGTGVKYGTYNNFTSTTSGGSYGVYNIFNQSTGNYFGMLNQMTGNTISAVFGVENNMTGTGSGAKTGINNSFNGTASNTTNPYSGMLNSFVDNGGGPRKGVSNNFQGTGNGNNYGLENTMQNSGNGNHFGTYNGLTGIGSGNKYGTYNYIGNASGGTHYGTYNEVSANTGWAGYFVGKNYISNRLSIGETDNPNALLNISGDSNATISHLELKQSTANGGARIRFKNATETTNEWVLFGRTDDTSTDSRFNIFHSGTGNIIVATGDGKVGINRTPVTNDFEVNGNASKATAGSWLANSDKRLKKNINTIEPDDALNRILKLRGVNYEWNDNSTNIIRPEGNQMGFIAQEIQEVFPEKVSEDKNGYLQTSYGDYDPVIFQAIKALNDKIEKLEKELKELKEKKKSE